MKIEKIKFLELKEDWKEDQGFEQITTILIDQDNNNIIGKCNLLIWDNAQKIVGMYINESFRGQGYSKDLMEYILYKLNDYSIDCYLDVNSNNTVAISLYKKYGFNIIDEFVENNILFYTMQKKINI